MSGSSAPLARPPVVRWSFETGGEVRAAMGAQVDDEAWVVALAGSVLQAADSTGRIRWSMPRRVVSRLIAVGDLAGDAIPLALVRGSLRELLLVDVRTGEVRWSWLAPDGTFVNDAGAVLLVPHGAGNRLLVAPIYATSLHAFDLGGAAGVEPAWEVQGTWDAGFGPSLIVADMDGTGQPRVVLSSRRGDVDRTHDGRHTSAQTVLGRRHGLLYQAVVDPTDGRMLREVAWAPNPRGHRAARPYGLLTAVAPVAGSRPSIVLACCQVEEYLAVTRQRPDGTLERAWSRFVEKDWPRDRQELRVHPDPVADLRGDGRPELVASLWDGQRWRTALHDIGTGHDRAVDRLADRVHWGCLRRSDGGVSIVVSVAHARSVRGPADLELIDGATLEVIDRLTDAEVVVTPGAPLPRGVAFMADRRGLARLPVEDGEAVAIRTRDGGVEAWWSGPSGAGCRVSLGVSDVGGVFGGAHDTLVADVDGVIRRLDATLRPSPVRMRTHGRAASVVAAWDAAPVIHASLPGGRIRTVGRDGPEHPASLPTEGTHLALRVDRDGREVARAHALTVDGRPTLAHRPGTVGPEAIIPLDAPLDRPPQWLADGSLLLTLRIGTHTLATEVRSPAGELRWRLDAGAYLHAPTPFVADGRQLVALDDHGVLMLVEGDAASEPGVRDATPRPVVRWRRDWTAAYGHPIVGPFLRDGSLGVLRADGIHGLELRDLRGRRRWRTSVPLWRYAAGEGVVVRSGGRHVLLTGRRDGVVEAVDIRDGRSLWAEPFADAFDQVALAVADVDDDGDAAALLGLPDGRLLSLRDVRVGPEAAWTLDLGAGVESVVVVPRPASAAARPWLVVATADGRVHLIQASSTGGLDNDPSVA